MTAKPVGAGEAAVEDIHQAVLVGIAVGVEVAGIPAIQTGGTLAECWGRMVAAAAKVEATDSLLPAVVDRYCCTLHTAVEAAVEGGPDWRFECAIRSAEPSYLRWDQVHLLLHSAS